MMNYEKVWWKLYSEHQPTKYFSPTVFSACYVDVLRICTVFLLGYIKCLLRFCYHKPEYFNTHMMKILYLYAEMMANQL